MTKKVCGKGLIISVLMIAFLILTFGSSQSFALGGVTDPNNLIWGSWEPNATGDEPLIDKVGGIVGVIRTIGILVSVGSIAYIGIKIMLGSIEEKASYKKQLLPWILGATMVFAITTVPTIIYDFASGAVGNQEGASHGNVIKNTEYWDGYDEAMKRVAVDNIKKEGVENLIEEVQPTNNYWSGYEEALKWLLDQQKLGVFGPASIANRFYQECIQLIENRQINRDNICDEIKKITNDLNTVNIEYKAMRYPKYIRLVAKAQEWNIDIDSVLNIKTWEEYAKGYDAAVEWYIANGDYIKLDEMIDEMVATNYTYWKGYRDYLKIMLNFTLNHYSANQFCENTINISTKIIEEPIILVGLKELEELYESNGDIQSKAFLYRIRLQKYILGYIPYNVLSVKAFCNSGDEEFDYWLGYDKAIETCIGYFYDSVAEIRSEKGVHGNSYYKKGYQDACDWLLTFAGDEIKLDYSITPIEDIKENAKYYKTTVIDVLKNEDVNEELIGDIITEQLIQRIFEGQKNEIVIERLEAQLEYLGCEINTWGNYAKGYDEALLFIGGYDNLELDWIKTRRSELINDEVQNAWVLGIVNAFTSLKINCGNKIGIDNYIRESLNIVEKIEDGLITSDNVEDYYTLYGEKEAFKHRLDIQQNIWCNIEFDFQAERDKEINME